MKDLIRHEIANRYAPRYRPAAGSTPVRIHGGLSGAVLWKYDAIVGPVLLRGWPISGVDRARLTRIHGWCNELGMLGVVPVPFLDLTGASIQEQLGRLWELGPWLPGRAVLTPSTGAPHVAQAFSALAQAHRILERHAETGPSPGMLRSVYELGRLSAGEAERLSQIAMATERNSCRLTLVTRSLGLVQKLAPVFLPALTEASRQIVRLQPCLRDVRPEHFLFQDDRLTGLVDYGAMGIESVSNDLARLAGEWFRGDRSARGHALVAYQQTRPLDAGERANVELFETAADLLIAVHWIAWHYRDGLRFEPSDAVDQGIQRGLARLLRLENRADQGRFLVGFR